MGNRPVNRRRRNTGRTGHYRGSSRSDTLRRRKRRNRRLKAVFLWLVCIVLTGLVIFGAVKLVGKFAGSGKDKLRKDGIEKLNAGDPEGAIADLDPLHLTFQYHLFLTCLFRNRQIFPPALQLQK